MGSETDPLRPSPHCVLPDILRGHKALVTGGNSGIGRGIALALAEAGADVAVNDVSKPEDAETTAAEIRKKGRKALAVRADVSKEEEEVRDMFARAVRELGALDVLVANAGVQRDAPFEDMTLEQWNRVLSVNLTGAFLCAREALRIFLKQGVREGVSTASGKILFVSSVHDLIPWAGHANYAVSKAGLLMLAKTLAQETAPRGVRVNALSPGAVRTDINRKVWEDPEGRRKMVSLIPSGRIGTVEDVGRAAAWLLADQADYVQGTTLYVDGGMTLYPGFATGG